MAGIPWKLRPERPRTDRQQMWQTIRIKAAAFTLPDLLITVPNGGRGNAKQLLTSLERHGYIAKKGPSGKGRPGAWQAYRLLRGHDLVELPLRCDRCGRPLKQECKKEDGDAD